MKKKGHFWLHLGLMCFTLLAIYPVLWVFTVAFSGQQSLAIVNLQANPGFVDRLRAILPWPEQVIYWTGIAELLGALALIQWFSLRLRHAGAIGLALYALGALLTIPASLMMQFNIFLVGFYVLTFGLAFLETSANPYILSMGSPETATRRLNDSCSAS